MAISKYKVAVFLWYRTKKCLENKCRAKTKENKNKTNSPKGLKWKR